MDNNKRVLRTSKKKKKTSEENQLISTGYNHMDVGE